MDLIETDVDSPACGFVKIDEDRKVLSCNQHAMNLLSRESVDDVVGLHIEELVTFATRIFINSYTYPMLLNEGKVEELQLSLKSMTGESVPVVANVVANRDKTTCWTFMSCSKRDQLYNELLSARDTLQSQAVKLTQLNDQIRERNSDLQAFCHSLSHDFTGPLQRIQQLLEFAKEDFQALGVDSAEPFKLMNSAQKNTITLLDMTKGLVEYLVADVPVPRNEIVDLEDIVASVLNMREKNDRVIPKIHKKSIPSISGSRGQIHLLFKNLIDNAIKYNDNDPVITISHTEQVASNRLVISVKDNGIGIADDHLDTIFSPFTRLHSTDSYKGSGLGLSIVKKMVMNHGGDIWVESQPGDGSTFYVSLPLKPGFSG